MKTISRYIMTLALLLTAVGGAWAQAPTIYFQQDYSTETVDWSTGTAGRYTPIVENGYLTVTQNKRNNNGATLTCTATQGKVDAGKDFTMTFNVKLGASDNQDATEFNIYDGSNSGYILSLAEGSAGATAWTINGGTQTATVSAGGGKSLNELSWIFVQVTSIAGENAKTYLTLKDDQNNIIDGFDKTEIPTISVAGGLGKMNFVTSRRLANFAIDNVLVRDVVNDDLPQEEIASDVEVTTNAASEQDLFTEASFKMPAFDATVNYMLVRDMQDEANPVTFSGLPTNDEPIIVKKGSDGKYQPAEALTIQLIDPLAAAEAQNIIDADGITVKVLVGDDSSLPIEYDHYSPITLEAFLADMKPGYYWIKAEQTDENSPYDGTVYSSQFTAVEQYDLTVKPANDFSKGKVESVTVGSGSVTIDANTGKATVTNVAPDTEVKIKAKRGYVIDKVEVKKGIAPPDPVTVTWNNLNFNSNPYTRDGVTLTAGNAASGNNFYDWGEKTFTNTIGKFTKIEIVCGDYNLDGWAQEKVGEYHDPEGPSFEIFKLTWTGNAESVTIPGKYVYSISSITFTIQ